MKIVLEGVGIGIGSDELIHRLLIYSTKEIIGYLVALSPSLNIPHNLCPIAMIL